MAENDIKFIWHHNPCSPTLSADSVKQMLKDLDSNGIINGPLQHPHVDTDSLYPRITSKSIYEQNVLRMMLKGEDNMFKKKKEEIEIVDLTTREEWIWVDGYKGTDRDMKCNGYQYILGQRHNMEGGFHLCRDLKDVFQYYGVEKGNRFFKVKALVRKSDFEEYGNVRADYNWYMPHHLAIRNKLVAKSIVLIEEVYEYDIFQQSGLFSKMRDFTPEERDMVRERGINYVLNLKKVNTLIGYGFNEDVAKYFVDHDHYDNAVIFGSQEGLSLDAKIFAIFAASED